MSDNFIYEQPCLVAWFVAIVSHDDLHLDMFVVHLTVASFY